MAIDSADFGIDRASSARRIPVQVRTTPEKRALLNEIAAAHGVSVGDMLDRYVESLKERRQRIADDFLADAQRTVDA